MLVIPGIRKASTPQMDGSIACSLNFSVGPKAIP